MHAYSCMIIPTVNFKIRIKPVTMQKVPPSSHTNDANITISINKLHLLSKAADKNN